MNELPSPPREDETALIDRPIFIVSTPRSGSTLLFDQLAQARDLFSVHGESHALIEGLPSLGPAAHDWSSNRLTSKDATPSIVAELSRRFRSALRDRDGNAPRGRATMLEKTPKNALRVSFFASAYPDSRFVYLYRDARESLASMMEAWASGHFRTYPSLPGWTGYPWSLLLVPEWQDLIGKPLPEIVAHQWRATTEILLSDLEQLPGDRVEVITYDALLADPQREALRLTRALRLEWDRVLPATLPLSKVTVSPPRPDKWRRVEHLLQPVMPIIEDTEARARAFIENRSRD